MVTLHQYIRGGKQMDKTFIDKMKDKIIANSTIPTELYNEYNVKRGLRNANGTGVLVGLTKVGDVHGYLLDEGETVPDKGRLRYRGIDVADITNGFQSENRFGFEEACYLLLFGTLPTKDEYAEFSELLASHRALPEGFVQGSILKFPSNDIMNKLARSILVSYSFDERPDDVSLNNVINQCIMLISQLPMMAAYSYISKLHYILDGSLYIHRPKPEYSHAQNFLHILRQDNEFTQLEAEVLDLCMVLHAEHGGGNNSTFTTHVVSSSGTDTYSVMASSIGSLKGPKHGGANIRVKTMMDDLKKNVKNTKSEVEIEEYLVKILKKEANDKSGLIYGIGHAVYTESDPRAVLLKAKAKGLAKENGFEDEFELYATVERLAPNVFAEVKGSDKVISANVDFYSGMVYTMLGIPEDLYTPIFAMSRIAGWSAHRIEELAFNPRIMRPAYKNVRRRSQYVPMLDR
jgi:citrate synthase